MATTVTKATKSCGCMITVMIRLFTASPLGMSLGWKLWCLSPILNPKSIPFQLLATQDHKQHYASIKATALSHGRDCTLFNRYCGTHMKINTVSTHQTQGNDSKRTQMVFSQNTTKE